MYARIDHLLSAAGDAFEPDFIGECEIKVCREGHSRARHTFMVGKRVIGRLRWIGMRRAVYEGEGGPYDIVVGPLGKRISAISQDNTESHLVERSRANPNKADLRVEMAEGDNFRLVRLLDSRLRSEQSFVVNKKFYNSQLLVFGFNTGVRSQTTVRVQVQHTMKWEARFLHRLLALVVCRIILERRQTGSHRVRVKEKKSTHSFASSARVRDRKRVY
jgi:hypothetical protein